MNTADRYVDDVMRNVFAAAEDRDRLQADLRSHFAEAEAEGRAPREVIEGLGTPEEVAAAFNAEREFRYAGFWQRLIAFVGDAGLLMCVVLPVLTLGLLAGVVGEEPSNVSIVWLIPFGLLFLAILGLGIFYFPLLEAHFGKTFGKYLMRIRVVREDGSPIGLGQAFVRRLSFYFDMLWVDALFVPFTDKRQRALDIVAKTIVVREPGENTPWWAYLVCLLLPAAAMCCLLCLLALFGPACQVS
jgi:uncharacterized RDD family membrane protein YckC